MGALALPAVRVVTEAEVSDPDTAPTPPPDTAVCVWEPTALVKPVCWEDTRVTGAAPPLAYLAVMPAAAAAGEVGQVMLMRGVTKAACPTSTPPELPVLASHVTTLRSLRGMTTWMGEGRVTTPKVPPLGSTPVRDTVRESMGRPASISEELVGLALPGVDSRAA